MLSLPYRRATLARLLVALLAALPAAAAAADEDSVFAALRSGGHAVLVRHALAPGGGDPPGFVLEDCATQRNLSEAGRAQAVRIGQRLRQHGVAVDRVLSSRWCRCLETARLMALAPVEPAPALDSFFGRPDETAARVAAVTRLLDGLGDRTLVLVTHQVTITALTGVFPASGEMVVVRPARTPDGGLTVIGRLRSD